MACARRTTIDGHVEWNSSALAVNRDPYRRANLGPADQQRRLGGIGYRMAIKLDNDISRPQPGSLGARSVNDLRDHGALHRFGVQPLRQLRSQIDERDPHPPALDLS